MTGISASKLLILFFLSTVCFFPLPSSASDVDLDMGQDLELVDSQSDEEIEEVPFDAFTFGPLIRDIP